MQPPLRCTLAQKTVAPEGRTVRDHRSAGGMSASELPAACIRLTTTRARTHVQHLTLHFNTGSSKRLLLWWQQQARVRVQLLEKHLILRDDRSGDIIRGNKTGLCFPPGDMVSASAGRSLAVRE